MPTVTSMTETPAYAPGDALYAVSGGNSRKLLTMRVTNIAAMTAILVPTNGMSVEVTEKGRGGLFVFDSADETAANNGTIFDAGDATAGSWVRRYSGAINVLWFGTNTTPGTTDMTAAIQGAIDAVYAQGGGEVFIPAGTYGVTSISRVWSGNISISIRGEGKAASILQKIAGTTTPVLNFSGSTLADISLLMSDFGVFGNAKGHNGINLTLLARMELQRLSIFTCDVALNSVGSLVFGVRECNINGNNIGYRSRLSGIVRANLVNFYGGTINANSTYGVDLGDCAGVNFWGTDFEGNGTAASLVTGAVNILATVDDELGQSNISFNNCWFELNKGMTIECAAATGLDLTFRTCMLIGAEGGNVANVGAIKNLILENIIAGTAGANPDTITSNATRTFILGGVLHTYVDNSITTKINHTDSSAINVFTTPAVVADTVWANERFRLKEAAAAGTGVATWGQLWVSNTTPQQLFFTDEAGTDKAVVLANNAELVTTTNVITAAESGKTFYLQAAGGFTSTLPAPALGLNYRFMVYAAPGSGTPYLIRTNGGANLFAGTYLDVVGEMVSFTAHNTITFVGGTALYTDSLEVHSDGVGWHCRAFSRADGGITTSVT